jgi:hypothetical protein
LPFSYSCQFFHSTTWPAYCPSKFVKNASVLNVLDPPGPQYSAIPAKAADHSLFRDILGSREPEVSPRGDERSRLEIAGWPETLTMPQHIRQRGPRSNVTSPAHLHVMACMGAHGRRPRRCRALGQQTSNCGRPQWTCRCGASARGTNSCAPGRRQSSD